MLGHVDDEEAPAGFSFFGFLSLAGPHLIGDYFNSTFRGD
jgi:hypothetical protein